MRETFQADFEHLLDDSISWAVVDYYKPGAGLAAGINAALIKNPGTNVIFLRNHGIVIGGKDVAEVSDIVDRLTQSLNTKPADLHPAPQLIPAPPESLMGQYAAIEDVEILNWR